MLSAWLVTGCLEEPKLDSKDTNDPIGLPSASIAVEQGILVFSSMQDYKTTLAELESECAGYVQNWMQGKDSLHDSTLLNLMIAQGIDFDQPLVDFEQHYGFGSLREVIEAEIQTFLDQEYPNWSQDPDDDYVDDEVMRTLLSPHYAVKIGGVIYMIQQNGSWFEITDGSFATMEGIIDETIDPFTAENVTVVDGEQSTVMNKKATGCHSNKRDHDYKPDGKYRIKWSISHRTYPGNRYVRAVTKNYQKKGKKWKKATAKNTWASVYGFISGVDTAGQANCDVQLDFNPYGYGAGGISTKVAHRIDVLTKTRSGWVEADHEGIDGITYHSVLTF